MYVIFLKGRGFKDFKYDMDMSDMKVMDMAKLYQIGPIFFAKKGGVYISE